VELRLASDGAVEVRSARLSPGMVREGQLIPLPRSADGWWRSGDGGLWSDRALVVMGRLDGALLSGGETVFPEELEGRLLGAVAEITPLPDCAFFLRNYDYPGTRVSRCQRIGLA
jgi:O-succinylbenzoic acid--CoA ligase